MKINLICLLFEIALVLCFSACGKGDKSIKVVPHSSWSYLKVSMIIDNGIETHIYGIPIQREPDEKGLEDVVIPNVRKSQFNPFPKTDDQILACGNVDGDNYMLHLKAVNCWQVWTPGGTAVQVFGTNPVKGIVIRSGLLKVGGELIVLDVGSGKPHAGAYIAPGMLSMYSSFPQKGDWVTICGPRPEDNSTIVSVACPMQIIGDHLVINDSP